uniref:Uncharacterized protein n=1 Tax=Rhizophora mucronata TaxID=61149 RepID=A0A2P2J0E4_RHIMU
MGSGFPCFRRISCVRLTLTKANNFC